MTLGTEIRDMVHATATRTFPEPMVIALPADEWRSAQARVWLEEMESRRLTLTPMEPCDSYVIYTAFGEVVLKEGSQRRIFEEDL